MGFRFQSSSCVVVGTFNIYIIQPKLLLEMGVIPTDCKVKLQSDFSHPGIRFELGDVRWNVRPERLAVESKNPEIDCGIAIGRLLEQLVWTPTMAVGVNTVFLGDAETEQQLPEHFKLPTTAKFETVQRTCHVSCRSGDSVLNLQLNYNAGKEGAQPAVQLMLNVHTNLSEKNETRTQIELNASARQACNSFLKQREEVVDFASTILECQDFSYDVNDVE